MLADADAEVAVEGLKDDVDGFAAGDAGVGVGVRTGQVGDQERPTDLEELDERVVRDPADYVMPTGGFPG